MTHPSGVTKLEVVDGQGVPLITRRFAEAVPSASVDLGAWGAEGTEVRITAGDGHTQVLPIPADLLGPLTVRVAAPAGQTSQRVEDGQELAVMLVDEPQVAVAVEIVSRLAGDVRVQWGDEHRTRTLRAGEHWLIEDTLRGAGGAVPLVVAFTDGVDEGAPQTTDAPDDAVSVALVPHPTRAGELRDQVRVRSMTFPTQATGENDPSRPRGRIDLPAQWWRRGLDGLGLGVRASDAWSPWAWQAIELENTGATDLNLVVAARVRGPDGEVDLRFRPRMRDGDDGSGTVRALLRLPAGATATAVLPFYVEDAALPTAELPDTVWQREIDVSPLGSSNLIHRETRPLYISRGSSAASAGLVVALLAAVLGTGMLVIRGPHWLRRSRTSELMTIALFGALTFVVSAVGRLLTLGVAMVLGPFATFLTGLVDDALRYTLLATLVTLQPRVGTAALAVLVNWLLSGLALGTFNPTDVLFVGGRVLWLEGALWVAGITRDTDWRDSPGAQRWLRLALGFGAASVLTSATGVVLHITLYRLFLADWYVAALLAGPGFLYVAMACAVAVPFADGLRRIQR